MLKKFLLFITIGYINFIVSIDKQDQQDKPSHNFIAVINFKGERSFSYFPEYPYYHNPSNYREDDYYSDCVLDGVNDGDFETYAARNDC